MNTELTHSQLPILVGQRLHPESPLYNMAFAFEFAAELRGDLFRQAWRRVADGSDALKTRILEGPDDRTPAIGQGSCGETELLDLSRRPDPRRAFLGWCRERCAHPLPLAGELVDSVLVRLGEGRTGWYLNQHHLIADAWSTLLIYRQVGAEYEVLLGGGSGERPALADYYPTAAAVRAWARRQAAAREAEAREHWAVRRELAGRRIALYGRAAEAVDTASTRLTLDLGRQASRALDRLARQDGFVSVSEELSRFALFATLLASWLHLVSGADELGFDAPVTGRPTPEAKRAPGLFIEMFPLTARVGPRDTFRSLGAACLEEAKLFLRHALPGIGSPAGAAAGNVVLNYFPATFGTFAGLSPQVEWIHSGHGDSVHALRLQVHDFSGSGSYTLHLDCNQDALPDRLWRRGREHFETLIRTLLDDPDRPIADVDLRTEDERRDLVALNATASPPPPSRSVMAMFEARADLEPDRVALRQGGAEVTFATLRERSEALAATLVARGLEPGDRVAIVGRRSILAVIAILATLRARGAYVPIDPAAPRTRLDHMLEDSGARMLLVGEGLEPPVQRPGLVVLSIAESIRAGRDTVPYCKGPGWTGPRWTGPGLDDLAYLMYTSGSTGRPKGVLVGHGGLADYLDWASRRYVRGDRLSFPLFTSLAFDLTITSLFLPLITGGTLEVYPESGGPADTALMDVVQANAVDFIKLTPSHLSLLARIGLEGSRIRRMVVGGENFSAHLAAAVGSQLQGRIEIHNEYGPTEAVVGCVAHRYDPRADTGVSVPIGVPADHVEVEILNRALTPVPAGTPGELWIARSGLAHGYHGSAGLTAERFQPRPSGPGRRYRSGDLVRLAEGGKLEYLGRIDRQLKISGFRVEPGEIESCLLSLPAIEQCAVVARRRPVAAPRTGGEVRHCRRCGLPSDFPRAVFDEDGVCSVCRSYTSIKGHAQAYFKTMAELAEVFEESARANESDFDCLMLLSGGKDSTYALCRLVEMGLSVYAFTLDNGFIAEGAKDNIRRVADKLGVPVEFASTPAMNAIFRDSLVRFANVCNGCFKTIYTLSMQRARELGIPIIVTGLSRGQMFETRLTEEMFRDGSRSPEEVDSAVLAARKAYHRVPDEVARSLDVSMFEDDRIFEQIRFIDFYRYCDVGMDEVLSYLEREVPWVRPADTGRSTNCLINDVGIYVHTRERGFHNYALPYSWDVRLGHKDRDAALAELDDEIDEEFVHKTLTELGYDEDRLGSGTGQTTLEAFYVASHEVSDEEIRRRLGERLPPQLIPGLLRRVESLPLTASGKVDEAALSREALPTLSRTPYRAPAGPVQEYLAEVWRQELGAERVGADDNFFELGGTSLLAMQVMLRLCREFDIDLPLAAMFSHPTLAALAEAAEDQILADVAELPHAELPHVEGP